MYTEWYATEFFSIYEPFENWVTGGMVQSTNVFDAWALFVNLSPDQDAEVTATFFYQDEPPQDFTFVLGAGRQGRLHMPAPENDKRVIDSVDTYEKKPIDWGPGK